MHADREWSLERVQPIEPSLLKRREIEARIAVPLIQAFAEKMKREQALAMATKVIQALACAAGREMAKKLGVNDMVAFTRVIRGVWAQKGYLEFREGQTVAQFVDERGPRPLPSGRRRRCPRRRCQRGPGR